jgi:hypothetical protein
MLLPERVFQDNRLFSVSPYRYDAYRRLREFGDAIEIISDVYGKILQFLNIGNVFRPTRQSFIYRFAFRENFEARWKMF